MNKQLENNGTRFGDSPEKVMGWLSYQLENTKDKIVVIEGWCKRCGLCVFMCPVKALFMGKTGIPEVNNDKCISCGTCEQICPDFAIVVTQLKKKK